MSGSKVTIENGKLIVPDDPILPFIEGDGIGPDIWAASERVLDAAVEKAYGGKRKIYWKEVLAGQKAFDATGEWLPDETLEAIEKYLVAIKGPLTTPVGGGHPLIECGAAPEVGSFCLPPPGALVYRCALSGETAGTDRYGYFSGKYRRHIRRYRISGRYSRTGKS